MKQPFDTTTGLPSGPPIHTEPVQGELLDGEGNPFDLDSDKPLPACGANPDEPCEGCQ